MRTIEQAMALDSLRYVSGKAAEPVFRTAKEVAEAFIQEMRFRGTPMPVTAEAWGEKWLASEKFVQMTIPLSCVALPCEPRDMNHMLSRIHAHTDKPIVVDLNKPGVGRRADGFVPPITVIDGKHRFAAAVIRGSKDIEAWVGELAASRIEAMPRIGLLKEAAKGRMRAHATSMDKAMALSSNRSTSEPLHHIIGRRLGMDPHVIQGMVHQYKTVHSRGRFGSLRPHMEAKSPPGWSDTTEEMKNHPEIDNPFALSWWLYDQGYRPHGGKK